MEKGFLDKVEDNAAIRTWSETTQHEKGDSLAERYVSKLWDFTRISITQNSLQDRQAPVSGSRPVLESCLQLLHIWEVDKAYSRAVNVLTFLKKLMNITEMSELWVAAWIKEKRDSKCIPWKSLKDLILAHLDTKKRVDVFALSIYGLVVFTKALGHFDEAVTNLFNRLDKRVTPVSIILAETFRSLNACRKAEDIEWRALWLLPNEIMYRSGDFDWVPLLGIWGAVGYVSLLVLRQYRSMQFIPTTQGIVECEFSYKGDGYKKKIREMSNAWNQTHPMKRLAVGAMTTPEYNEWWVRRINDNIPKPSQGNNQSIEEHLRVVPSELEIIRQDFKGRNADLEKKME
ncbi:hypothetical protein Goklo_029725 [Gossypium klotzschianum]|uniref:DUF7745 domain-containing protein n=2 Tax=Gossypium klotzschianum TaxID=34286 RepID=A0A7J8WCP6_9ROSI|nr:hypothetical protein [Gossypium klotzschianum]